MIDTLYKYYIYSHQINPQEYSEKKVTDLMGDKIGPDVLFKMKDVNIDQLIKVVKKK